MKYRAIINYADHTRRELFADTPVFPLENAEFYHVYNVETSKITYMQYGYWLPDQDEPSWHWIMTLPMTQEEIALHTPT